MSILNEGIKSLHDKLVKQEITSTDLVKATFDRIHAVDGQIKAFLTLNEEEAYKQAAKWDKRYQAGENLGLFAGLPIGIKDNIVTKNLRTTCASKILHNFDPIYDAFFSFKFFCFGNDSFFFSLRDFLCSAFDIG